MENSTQLTPEQRWKILKGMSINSTMELYPKATREEATKYVEELFLFEKFLMEKYNKSFTEVADMVIIHIKKSMNTFEQNSSCIKNYALSHDYPYAEELEASAKVLDIYLKHK